MYLTPSQHRARIQYTVRNTLHACEGWAWCPEDSFVFCFFWTWATVLSYFIPESRASFVTYMPMKRVQKNVLVKTGDTVTIRARLRNKRVLPQSGPSGRNYAKRGRKLGRAELLMRVAACRGREPGMTA